MPEVPLLDGPFEGAEITVGPAAPASLILEGPDIPEGMVARYRYSPKKHGYVFKELDQVALRIPVTPAKEGKGEGE